MKKKFISLLLSLVMLLPLGLSACEGFGNSSTPPCAHEYETTTYLAATCISEGVEEETCKNCGEKNYHKTEKVEHDYQDGVCSMCKNTEESTTIVIPQNPSVDLGGCLHTTVVMETVDPSCASVGMKVQTCVDCGAVSLLEVYPATGEHDWQESRFVATCTSDGIKTRYCKKCGLEEFVEHYPKLGHNVVDGKCTRCDLGKDRPQTGTVETYDGSAVTVTFYHTMNAVLRDVLDRYISEFNEIYPNITIEHQYVGGYDNLRDQIATDLASGHTLPSLAYCYSDHVALYNNLQAVMPMDEYIAHPTMGLSQAQLDDFIDVFYEEGRIFGDSKMYMLPMAKSTEVLYYNKTFFEKHNLKVPATWDQVATLCAQIKAIDPLCVPFTYDSEANWFITLTEQLNSGYTSLDGEKFVFDTETNRMFVEELREMYKRGYITTSAIYGAYTSELFTQTNVNQMKSYMCVGSSAGASYQCPVPNANNEYPFEVGVTMIPQANENNQKVVQQGPSLCMFKKSNAQEMAAAWLFAKYLTTTVEVQGEFSLANSYMPVIKSAQEHPVYQNFLDKADGNKYLQATVIQQAFAQKDYYFASPAFNGSSAARAAVGELLQNCFVEDPAEGQSVADFIKAQFKKAIDTLTFDYGY